ncbi:MAG: hypothetical protein MUF45_01825 [Spirosomaceae bacterium]|nr:hypothetical protein [Spirosomataceae bacterium]
MRSILFVHILLIFLSINLNAQKHNFVQYSVENDLIQTQAISICQDSNRHLWVSTLGGISRFDGKNFTNFTHSEGLLSNFTFKVFVDSKQNIWIATQLGISCFDGKNFTNYPIKSKAQTGLTNAFIEDSEGTIWFNFFGGELYKIKNAKLEKVKLPNAIDGFVSTLAKDPQNNILIAVWQKGVWKLAQNNWKKLNIVKEFDDKSHFVRRIFFDKKQNFWMLTNMETYRNSEVFLRDDYVCINQDLNNNIWFGSTKGVLRVAEDGKQTFFNAQNGFTNQTVHEIINDVEGNLWFATDGTGIYRYSRSVFTYIDESLGLKNSAVMSITEDKSGKTWFATNGGGLGIWDGKKVHNLEILSNHPNKNRINVLASVGDVVWIGTDGAGLWYSKNNTLKQSKTKISTFLSASVDEFGQAYFGTPLGAFRLIDDDLVEIPNTKEFISSICGIDKNTILVGTSHGLILLKDDKLQNIKSPNELKNSLVMSIVKHDDKIFIATANNGLYIWDKKDKFLHFNKTHGLSSNHIYSLIFDKQNRLWVGTGNYLNRLIFNGNYDKVTVKKYSKEQGFFSVECNQNAVFNSKDGFWIGTVKGVFKYHPEEDKPTSKAPLMVLKDIKLFSNPLPKKSDNRLTKWYDVPKSLVLNHSQNHLTFNFIGIHLSNPESVRYQYYTEGLEKGFSELSSSNSVIYPSIPAGDYTFKVRAIEADGLVSNTVEFPFSIKSPFYGTLWFQGLVLAFFTMVGVAIQQFRTRQKERRRKEMTQIRLEEQYKVRKKTAEDFHDEMGNKLTRISILTDILTSKMSANDELQKIVNQIKENAASLYNGTKDIIWSLSPDNDNLFEILLRVQDFGVEIFQDTNTDFESIQLEESYRNIKLPIDYSRNLIMICKESLTNVLKHAQASKVWLRLLLIDECLIISVLDNGRGFDIEKVKKGNGLNNIQIRAKRINSTVEVLPNEPAGIEIRLQFKIPVSELQ